MISRRVFLKAAGTSALLADAQHILETRPAAKRPNILLALADDQSWQHTGAAGCRFVHTPAFDRIAREGLLFTNAFAAAPQCSPNRAAILTGRHIGSLREAGTHASLFPRDLTVYTDLLEKAGYLVGLTGKGWSPGNFRDVGWPHNPAGKEYSAIKTPPPAEGISNIDYAANFEAFLADRKSDQPFCFWLGCNEPHRGYQHGIGASKHDPAAVTVPGYLPDRDEVRRDFLDYAYEIEWFDAQLAKAIDVLEKTGELDNTLIVVTADNGMPFPRAKATLYDDGIHVPMAIRWASQIKNPGRTVNDLVSHVDLAPTFLQAAGVTIPPPIQGRSLTTLLCAATPLGKHRDFVMAGRERHSSSRPDNVGYPSRAIRTEPYLYIHNFKPDRYPLGDAFDDVDDGPTKSLLMQAKTDPAVQRYFESAHANKPQYELYDITKDQACLKNLAYDPAFVGVCLNLGIQLEDALKAGQDPRVLGTGDIFDSYPRFSPIRPIAGPQVTQGKYVTKFLQRGQQVDPKFLP